MSSLRWNLVQAILWIMAEDSTRIESIQRYASSVDGDPSLFSTLLALQHADSVAVRTTKNILGHEQEVFVRGGHTAELWSAALIELTSALLDSRLDVWGLTSGHDKRELIDEDYRDRLLIREDFEVGPYLCLASHTSRVWTSVRLSADQVKTLWPMRTAETLQSEPRQLVHPSRKRGPKPRVGNRVRAEMREAIRSGADLASWPEESLAAEFNASRGTCRDALTAVLSEFVENSQSEMPTTDN